MFLFALIEAIVVCCKGVDLSLGTYESIAGG